MMANIFIVEDDISLRALYEKALNMKGYQVIASAKNGKEAIEMFKKFHQKPDVIIMDHRMPLKNGLQVTKEMLEIDKSLKIIFISADQTIREKALSMGVINFTDKPCSVQKLYRNIEDALRVPKIY